MNEKKLERIYWEKGSFIDNMYSKKNPSPIGVPTKIQVKMNVEKTIEEMILDDAVLKENIDFYKANAYSLGSPKIFTDFFNTEYREFPIQLYKLM